MRVYSCITAREVTNMYKGEYEPSAIIKGENSHKYEKKLYPFFKYSQSAEYFFKKCKKFGMVMIKKIVVTYNFIFSKK